MSSRFVDNVTPLNAETLNKFEEDMRIAGLPIFNATRFDDSFFNFEINDERFEKELKIGYVFVMIPNASSKGTSNKILAIKHGNYCDPLYWNDMDVQPEIGSGYAHVNNRKYLVENIPYIVKCFGKVSANYQFIITEMFNMNATNPATQTQLGGVRVWVDEDKILNLSTRWE